MKILVITPIYRRYEVLKIYLEGIKRLSDEFEIMHLMIGSGDDVVKSFMPKFSHYIECENVLGKKLNEGLKYASHHTWDYMLSLGSDDIISNFTLKYFIETIKNNGYDFVGLLDNYIFDYITKEHWYWPGYTNYRKGETAGSNRIIKRNIIECNNYMLWDSTAHKGLDLVANQNIFRYAHNPLKMYSKDVFAAFGLITPYNVTPMAAFIGSVESCNIPLWQISEKERQMLNI